MLSRLPVGAEDAKVALTTRDTVTTVMYHRLVVLQFLGFSMSFVEKSTCPSWFRWTSRCVILADLYGFAVGRDLLEC